MRISRCLRNLLIVLFLWWLNVSIVSALPSLGTGRMIDGSGQFSTTTTTFTGGAALNGINHQANITVNSDAVVNLQGSIQVAPSDVGKQADLLVVVGVEPNEPFDGGVDTVYRTIDEFGERSTVDLYNAPTVWLNQLTDHPFKRNVSLTSDLPVDIGALSSNVDKNVNYVFIGYRLADGSVIYSPQPVILNVLGNSPNAVPTPKIVQITPTDTDRVTLAWLPVQSGNTPATAMRYEVHISEQPNFQPTTATLRQTIVGNAQATITGLSAGKDYFVVVRALDSAGKYSQNEELRTFATFSEPVIVNPNVTIIEDKSVGLGQATQQGDTYVYQNTSGNPPSVGTILFANVGDETYLRKVESVTATANGLNVQTSDVELTEALQQGAISSEMTLFDVDAEATRIGQRSQVRTSRIARDGSQQMIMQWQDGALVAEQQSFDNNRSVRASKQELELSASVRFTPSLKTKIDWKFDLVRGVVITSGEIIARGQFSADANVFYNFDAAGSAKREIPLFNRSFTLRYLVGGVPVYQRNILSVKAVLSANASSEIKANAGANATAAIEMGARFNPATGGWNPIPPTPSFEKSFKAGLDVKGDVHGEVRLIPNLQVEFYRVVAADLSVEPFVTGDIGTASIPKGELLAEFGYAPIQLTKFDINLQAQAFIGVSVGIFSKKFPVLGKTQVWESPQWLLFSLPKLSASGGSGKVNEAINLTATTKDGKNDPFKDGSIKWFVSPNKATVSGGKAGTFTSSNEGSYTVFFSGHGYLGDPLARQFAVTDVVVTKKDEQAKGGHGISSRCHSTKNNSHGIASRCSSAPAGWSGSYNDKKQKQGIWTYMYDSGNFDQDTYANDIRNGYSGHWKADCKPTGWHGIFDSGNRQGIWTYVYDSGAFDQDTFVDSIRNGYSGHWKTDGKPTGWHGVFDSGNRQGIWTYVYDSGAFDQDTFVDSIRNGYSGHWTAECKPESWHGDYVNGDKDGIWTYIYSSGNYDTDTYVKGTRNGGSAQWKADGSPTGWHGSYVNGNKNGTWTYYCSNGKTETSSYANGVHQGDAGSCY